MYRCTSDIFHCCTAKNKNKTKKQNQGETQTPYELFLYVCFFWFWGCGVGLTAQRPVLVCWWQNSRTEPKPKKQKNKTLRRLFGLDSQDVFFMFFLVFLVFFCFFWFRSPKRQKTPGVFWFFQVHGWRQSPKNQKTPGVFVFLDFATKKKTQGKPKKTSFESKPKNFLKVLFFCFFGFPCVFGF